MYSPANCREFYRGIIKQFRDEDGNAAIKESWFYTLESIDSEKTDFSGSISTPKENFITVAFVGCKICHTQWKAVAAEDQLSHLECPYCHNTKSEVVSVG